MVFLLFFWVLDGLERSGRLVGTIFTQISSTSDFTVPSYDQKAKKVDDKKTTTTLMRAYCSSCVQRMRPQATKKNYLAQMNDFQTRRSRDGNHMCSMYSGLS